MRRIFVVLGVFVLTVGCAKTQTPPAKSGRIAVAILDLEAKGEESSKGVADALTEILRNDFANQDSIDLLPREKMFELAKKKGLQLTGCTDVACAVRIGKALNVQTMVTGSVIQLGLTYTLYLRAVDVEKEVVEFSVKEDAGIKDVACLDSVSGAFVGKAVGCMWEQTWRGAVQRNLGDAEAHYQLGRALRRQDRNGEAEKEYREAIRLNPGYAEAHTHLGVVLSIKGEEDEAIKECREAIRLKPELADAHSMLGIALSEKGEKDEAVKEGREGFRLDPDNAWALQVLAILLDERGNREEARVYWKRALELETKPEDKKDIGLAPVKLD